MLPGQQNVLGIFNDAIEERLVRYLLKKNQLQGLLKQVIGNGGKALEVRHGKVRIQCCLTLKGFAHVKSAALIA